MDQSQRKWRGGGRKSYVRKEDKNQDTRPQEDNVYISSSSRDDSRQDERYRGRKPYGRREDNKKDTRQDTRQGRRQDTGDNRGIGKKSTFHTNEWIRTNGRYDLAWEKFVMKQDPKYRKNEETFGVDDIDVFRREFRIGASDKTSRQRAIDEAVKNLQGCRGPLLDIGSMDGTITIGLKKGLGIDDAYGIDLNPTLREGVTQVYYEEDGVTMNLQSGSIATVTCLQVLHHVENIEALANEIGRVMQPGGILYIKDHDCPDDHQGFRYYMDAVHKYYMVVNEEPEEDPIFYRSRTDLIRFFLRDFYVKRVLEVPVGFLEVFSTRLCRKGLSLPGWESQLMGNFMRSYYWYIYEYFFSDAPKALSSLGITLTDIDVSDVETSDSKLSNEEYLRIWLSRESSPWQIQNIKQDVVRGYRDGDIIEVDEDETGYYLCGLLR